MNWDKIKEKYPKAFYLLSKWYYKTFYKSDNVLAFDMIDDFLEVAEQMTRGRTFDFFDEQGIYIEIYRNPASSIGGCFTYKIDSYDNGKYSGYQGHCKLRITRTEAEEKGFEKAFSILENKLEGD